MTKDPTEGVLADADPETRSNQLNNRDADQLRIEARKLWMEQSKLFWSRLQTLAVIEGGVLAAAYRTEKQPWHSIAILTLGSLLLTFIWLIMVRDRRYLDDFEKEGALRSPPGRKGRLLAYAMNAVLLAFNLVYISYLVCTLTQA